MNVPAITVFISKLGNDEKSIFYSLISYKDGFSLDWFSEFTHSKLFNMVQLLKKQHWISPTQENYDENYVWSSESLYQEILEHIPAEELSIYYQHSVERLIKLFPKNEDMDLIIAKQSLVAGLREEHLDIVLRAATSEENHNRVYSAIRLYEAILSFIEQLILTEQQLSETNWNIFTHIVERRASLSLFHPSLKNVKRFLHIALENALKRGDLKDQAYLELLIGQNHWLYFQHGKAVEHFNRGWEIIQKVGDTELYRNGLKVQGLVHAIRGDYFKAIESYENSLGELDSVGNNDFFIIAALTLAICYNEVGMSQRGLGISEAIQNHCKKNENLPLLAFALSTAGLIFLDNKNLKESRTHFEKSAELAGRENLPMVQAISGVGLANIYYQEGNYELAAQHYKNLWKIKNNSLYVILNFFPLFETSFYLRSKDLLTSEMQPFFSFIDEIKPTEVSAYIYSRIQRLQLTLPEKNYSRPKRIEILSKLEENLEKIGPTFELSNIRIELAKQFLQENDLQKAQDYAIKSWNFLRPIAQHRFPSDLRHLIPKDDSAKNNDVADLVIEMSQALVSQENLEVLLTNIINSITKLSGSERTAIFIKDHDSSELKIIASRNLFVGDMHDEKFQKRLAVIKSAVFSEDSAIKQYEISSDDETDARHIIILPLKLSNRVIGALYSEGRFFNFDLELDETSIKFMYVLASQIALSIDSAQANDEIVRLNKKLLMENLYYIEEIENIRPFSDIVGTSQAIKEVQVLVRKVAPTQSTVLIYGETGVGKELVARAIHRESQRKNGPFIRVNCAALPDTLIDSELFGHEKGAFTGAIRTKEGRFELANNGTIFLDEISELPLSTQSRLLRILQEKEFQRVGGTKTLHSNFRLIVATNRRLEEEVTRGKFRSDLFYRLNVFPIHVPPLRDRKEDIPLLVAHFVNLYGKQNSKEIIGISNAEMEKLKAYSWPGNIRELSNMIELAVIMGGSKIRFPELYKDHLKHDDHNLNNDLNITLKNQERELILMALKKSEDKISGPNGAADLLGMNRSTLKYRMKKLGIKSSHRYESQ